MCRSWSLRHDGPTFERRVQGGCSPSRVSGERCTNASTRHGTAGLARVHLSTIEEPIENACEDKKSKTSCDISSKAGNSVSISETLCLKGGKGRAFFEVNLRALAFCSAPHPTPLNPPPHPPSSTSKHKRFSF